jgi:hypothetical protein
MLSPEKRFTKEITPPVSVKSKRLMFGLVDTRDVQTEPTKKHTKPKVETVVVEAQILRGETELQPYFPLRSYSGPFLLSQLARVRTEQDALEFVNQYGPLLGIGCEWGEYANVAIEFARKVRALLTAHHADDDRAIRRELGNGWTLPVMGHAIAAHLVFDQASAKPRLKFTANHLYDVLWLQLAEVLSGGVTVRECLHCGLWFEAGPGTDLRADSKFCSDKHKTAFHNAQRKDKKGK